MAEVRHMPLSLYATPPEQTPFLSPTNEYHLCQQWPRWDYQISEPVFSPGNSAGSMSSMQWEAEQQSHPSFEATRSAADYPTASWASQPENWSPYHHQQQQHIQPPQATTTKKKPTKPGRKPAEPRLLPTAQHRSKKARVGAGSEPSPANSLSYDENGEGADEDDEGEDSDASLAPPGRDRKKTYRVKNRAAAKRCREKTKQYEIDLANKEKQVTQERMYLDACVTALKNEVLTLKNQILQHGSCDCEMIQGYIARTASTVSVAGHDASAKPRSSV
ncbi:basic leucine zipper (bZIP) transcription factor atfB [Colletotrichum spaethianum]|uniref:Basic leucine zipper (BZIP) transcription factor atfB n=1 Tax=Colletotrichum spaethianum TaxID=700344 RepID=A0AA37UK21_9PEZI|nr:basic leucine zipper (bZIP) transcription factor atfB [Colletotrichum spaethianum]GKT50714.1 basic leucine zipper (bZIP) transcription factor atfB [Colletotrichum spaethianum]